MNKSTKIGIVIVVVLALIIVTLYFVSLATNRTQTQTPNDQTGTNTTGNFSGNAGLPVENLQGTVLRVKNTDNSDQIKKAYEDYINQDYKAFRYIERDGISDTYSPSDKEANLVPLKTFMSSIGADVNPKIKNIVGTNFYGLFYCINQNKEKEYGVAFDIGSADAEKKKSNYADAQTAMRSWEPFLLKDLRNILFPTMSAEEKFSGQMLVFKDGKTHYAEVDLPTGKGSMNYQVVGDPLYIILIATSQSCVEKAFQSFSALD